jgi:hypothetical protein
MLVHIGPLNKRPCLFCAIECLKAYIKLTLRENGIVVIQFKEK